MAASLKRSEQSLLYLNRRGTARLVLCQNCGWQAICPNCDLPLTYHADHHVLVCHVCNHREAVATTCPTCGHTDLLFRSVGTKAIAEEAQRLFPDARIMRFDSDNNKRERLEQHYTSIARGDIDIIVGTQTIAKGLDLPKLSTLGVAMADTSLYIPDYTAQEQTYQLLNQVVGRISRGHRSTSAYVQTYAPENAALRAALGDAWEEFYASELEERRLFKYPPYYSLLKLTCRRKSAASAQRACAKLVEAILAFDDSLIVDGPAPAMHEKFQDTYQWQVIVKSPRRGHLLELLPVLPRVNFSFDIDPTNLL
jgi:primosomal protein N' (replication factor Y)